MKQIIKSKIKMNTETKQLINLIPLGSSVWVVRDEDERKTDGGIILTAVSEKTVVTTGIVVGKGDGCKRAFNVGDRIKFNLFADTEVEFEGKYYILMDDMDVLAILPSKANDLSMTKIKRKRIDIQRPDFNKM